METELFSLYNAFSSYKRAIVRNLERVDENISDILNGLSNTCAKHASPQKYQISLELLTVLQSFVNILYLTETVVEDLSLKHSSHERSCCADGDTNVLRKSNSFTLPQFKFLTPERSLTDAKLAGDVEEGRLDEVPSKLTQEVFPDTEGLVNISNTLLEKKFECSSSDAETLVEEKTTQPSKVEAKVRLESEVVNETVDVGECVKPTSASFEKCVPQSSPPVTVGKSFERKVADKGKPINTVKAPSKINIDNLCKKIKEKSPSQSGCDVNTYNYVPAIEYKTNFSSETKVKSPSQNQHIPESTSVKHFIPSKVEAKMAKCNSVKSPDPHPSKSLRRSEISPKSSAVKPPIPLRSLPAPSSETKIPKPRLPLNPPEHYFNNVPTKPSQQPKPETPPNKSAATKPPPEPEITIIDNPSKEPTVKVSLTPKFTADNSQTNDVTVKSEDFHGGAELKPPEPQTSKEESLIPPIKIQPKEETVIPPIKIEPDDDSSTFDDSNSEVTVQSPCPLESPTSSISSEDKSATNKSKTPPPPETQYSAITKLMNMNVHDRYREAEKRYEGKHAMADFKLTKRVLKSPRTSPLPNEKKAKEKCAIFELQDDKLNVNELCVFSYIESPQEFYLRNDQQLFEKLECSFNEDLNEKYQYVMGNHLHSSKAEAKALLGNFCFLFLADRHKWFRVEVLDWLEGEAERILVQLVDYGDKYFCRYKHLKGMIELYSEFPRMAIRCHFAAIYSPDRENRTHWPPESIAALEELSEMKKCTRFLVIYAHKEGNSYAVDLMKEDSEKTLAQILVENELAMEDKFLQVIAEEPEEEEILEYDNINEAIEGYDAKDEARICPFTDSSGGCFKGPSCKLEHSKLSADGITTDKVLSVSRAFNKLELPSAGEYIEVLITGYVNTCHFYVHIINNRKESSMYNDEFDVLVKNINSKNVLHTCEPFKMFPSMGEIVLASRGEEWHRALCVGHDNDEVEVFFVDFGIRVSKKLTDLRQMKEDFLYTPFQAVECLLATCCEKSDVTPEASWGFYLNNMNLKSFKAHVVETNEPLRLNLWDAENMDMSYVLKTWGLGQDRNSNLFPKQNSILSCA